MRLRGLQPSAAPVYHCNSAVTRKRSGCAFPRNVRSTRVRVGRVAGEVLVTRSDDPEFPISAVSVPISLLTYPTDRQWAKFVMSRVKPEDRPRLWKHAVAIGEGIKRLLWSLLEDKSNGRVSIVTLTPELIQRVKGLGPARTKLLLSVLATEHDHV